MKFHGIPLIWIRVSNSPTKEDLSLRHDFAAWQRANDIFPVAHGDDSSLDPRHGFEGSGYKPDDARRVIQWLKDHGAEIDPGMFTN